MNIESYKYIKSVFLRNGEKLKFKMGQSISDDNYLSGAVYLIEEGSARVIYKDGSKFKTIAKISSGSCVGATSLIRSSACENIRASTELLAYKISDQEFISFYQNDSKFKKHFDLNYSESEVIHFANYLTKNLFNSEKSLPNLFAKLKNSFQTFYSDLNEIVQLLKIENKKIFLAQKLEGFDFYFFISDENKAKQRVKYSDDKKKIRFISVDYDLNKQNA